MKATLSFSLPEDEDMLLSALKATDLKLALWEIEQRLFRPIRKHGYANAVLDDPNVYEAISQLSKMFYEILEERDIKL